MSSVCDEGIGIDPNDDNRVFEVFESLDIPDDRSEAGIGLALCERIVAHHGGDIWVDSEPARDRRFLSGCPQWDHNE